MLPLIETKHVGVGALVYHHESNESSIEEHFMAPMFTRIEGAHNFVYIDYALQK